MASEAVERSRIEELRSMLLELRKQGELEKRRIEELVGRLDQASRLGCLSLVAKHAGKKMDKKHGEYRILRLGDVEVWYDTYNGYLEFYRQGRRVTAGHDRDSFMQHVLAWESSIDDLERIVDVVESLPVELCTLAEILDEAIGLGARELAEQAARELHILLGQG